MKKTGLIALGLGLFLTGCTSISAPVEEAPSFAVPTVPVVTAPNLEFTLPIYPLESLHPTIITNKTNMALAPLLYEGLYVLDENFTAIPQLVAEHQVENGGLRWVFTLKEGVTFWDGTALTGQIVASALKEAMIEESYYAPRFRKIQSISGTKNQVVVNLYAPNANLPSLLDVPISYGGGSLPKGTGPYVYDSTEKVLRRNGTWHGTGDLPEVILLDEMSTAGDLVSAFDSGDLSMLDGDLTGNQVFGYSGNYQVWQYNTTSLYYLGFDTTNEAVGAKLRGLISEAIHREDLVKQSLAGYGTATIYPIHPSVGITEPLVYEPLDTAIALGEYEELPTLTLLVNGDNPEKTTMAEQIATQLWDFGLEIIVDAPTWEGYVSALEQGRFDLYLSEIFLTCDFDLSSLLLSSGIYNYGKYVDERSDQLWWAYRSDGVGEEPHFFSYFYEQMPIAPLCFKNGTGLSQWGHLSHATPTVNHLFYGLEHWVVEKPETVLSGEQEDLVEVPLEEEQ